MQAILCLLDHPALAAIHDFIGNFLAPAGGKAMQEDRILAWRPKESDTATAARTE